MLSVKTVPSPVGKLLLSAEDGALTGLWIEGQKYFAAGLPGTLPPEQGTPVLEQAADWLGRYFSGGRPSPHELPLKPAGTPFRRLLWQELCAIPYGEATTYGALAKRIASRMGRDHMPGHAVGGAIGHNPISIIIPCHRVLSASGRLTGYAGGLAVKRALLELEGVLPIGTVPPSANA